MSNADDFERVARSLGLEPVSGWREERGEHPLPPQDRVAWLCARWRERARRLWQNQAIPQFEAGVAATLDVLADELEQAFSPLNGGDVMKVEAFDAAFVRRSHPVLRDRGTKTVEVTARYHIYTVVGDYYATYRSERNPNVFVATRIAGQQDGVYPPLRDVELNCAYIVEQDNRPITVRVV